MPLLGRMFLAIPFLLLFRAHLSFPQNPFGQNCVHPLRIEQSHSSPYETKHGKYISNGTKARFTVQMPSSGFIASDGYPNGYENQKCSVELIASSSSGLVIHLSFVALDLETQYSRSEQCLRDYVVITIIDRDGREHIGDRICGDKRPKPMRTMQQRARILFIASSLSSNTERTQKWKGFRMQFEFVPESTILAPSSFYHGTDRHHLPNCGGINSPTEMSGEINSPGFPYTYPRNVTCNWLLRVAPDHRINIRLLEIEFSSAFECERASLQFFDGYRHDLEMAKVGTGKPTPTDALFCGGSAYYQEEGMKSFLSERNRVFVRFTTRDGPSQKQLEDFEAKRKPIGFRLIWTEVQSLVRTSADDPRTLRTSPSGATRQSFVTAEQCAGFVCSGGEFCVDATENICVERSRLCINETLRCDGMANCAENDDSDESFCFAHKMMSLATVVMLLFVLLPILLSFSLSYCIFKCLRVKPDKNGQKCQRKNTKSNDGNEKVLEEREARNLDGRESIDTVKSRRGTAGKDATVHSTVKNGNVKSVTNDKGPSPPCICLNESLAGMFNGSDVWTKRVSAGPTESVMEKPRAWPTNTNKTFCNERNSIVSPKSYNYQST